MPVPPPDPQSPSGSDTYFGVLAEDVISNCRFFAAGAQLQANVTPRITNNGKYQIVANTTVIEVQRVDGGGAPSALSHLIARLAAAIDNVASEVQTNIPWTQVSIVGTDVTINGLDSTIIDINADGIYAITLMTDVVVLTDGAAFLGFNAYLFTGMATANQGWSIQRDNP